MGGKAWFSPKSVFCNIIWLVCRAVLIFFHQRKELGSANLFDTGTLNVFVKLIKNFDRTTHQSDYIAKNVLGGKIMPSPPCSRYQVICTTWDGRNMGVEGAKTAVFAPHHDSCQFEGLCLSTESEIFWAGSGAQVGNLHLEVHFISAQALPLGAFFLLCFMPWDPTNPEFGRRRIIF